MQIFTVWVQREQRYEGQYLPELVAAIDQNGHADNPDYIHGEVEKQRAQDDIVSAEFVLLNLPDLTWEKIEKILRVAEIHSRAEVYPHIED